MAAEKHHNHTESEIVDMQTHVQNWYYFRFVVAILKDRFAVGLNSNSIYLASGMWATYAKLILLPFFVHYIFPV